MGRSFFLFMLYLRNSGVDPYWNMAFDEYVLTQMRTEGTVFSLWQNRPSVIIGLNQNAFREVNIPYLEEKGIALARRVTGGGAVYHDLGNLNYTISGPADFWLDGGFTAIIAHALRSMGARVSVTGRNDFYIDKRKCSGFAKRLYKDRILIHGTLMFDVNLDEMTRALASPESKFTSKGIASVRRRVANLKDYLPGIDSVEMLKLALEDVLRDGDGTMDLSPRDIAAISRSADEKFRTREWIFGKSPSSSACISRKFPTSGTVEASFDLVHGRIRGLRFSGDFIGSLPAGELAAALEGVELSAVGDILKKTPAALYFDGVADEDLRNFLLGD